MSRPLPRAVVAILLTILSSGLVWDLCHSPDEQWSAAVILAAIDLYQSRLSPRMEAAGIHCRFEPTCSRYAEEVIRRQGAFIGSWRASVRVIRCGPWIRAGTVDQP